MIALDIVTAHTRVWKMNRKEKFKKILVKEIVKGKKREVNPHSCAINFCVSLK